MFPQSGRKLPRRFNTMGSKKDIHVVPHPEGGWATRREGNSRVSERHTTQKDAIDTGRARAKDDGVELVIHGRDGKIRDKDSFGNDPCPPKDEKH